MAMVRLTLATRRRFRSDLLQLIRHGVADTEDRSAVFHSVVAQLKRRRWTVDAIAALLEKYPTGLRGSISGACARKSSGPTASTRAMRSSAAADEPAKAGSPMPRPHVLPTIRIIAGQLPRVVQETERALIAAGAPIFSRAGTLVRPCVETTTAADGRKTIIARLHPFVVPLATEWMASAAMFQRFNGKRNALGRCRSAAQVAEALLARKGLWTVPRVSGVITTPTLRTDGSLLADPGYDVATGLYLALGLDELTMPMPTREAAQTRARVADRSVRRVLLRSSHARSLGRALRPAHRAGARLAADGTDVLGARPHSGNRARATLSTLSAAVATGRLCPVITASKSTEETEKRLGAVLLSGAAIDLARQLHARSWRRAALPAD